MHWRASINKNNSKSNGFVQLIMAIASQWHWIIIEWWHPNGFRIRSARVIWTTPKSTVRSMQSQLISYAISNDLMLNQYSWSFRFQFEYVATASSGQLRWTRWFWQQQMQQSTVGKQWVQNVLWLSHTTYVYKINSKLPATKCYRLLS